ncbi:DUF4931 domain-containing protein [Furfurilactobacillus siliginis]|uniref:Galactose-1-phosphate uridylyltransferase n=1 Tax=Furfurilactobacillus siliginis TaxID=348151 RepID=A0A0R2L6C2_9LACO|nr:galactose-1-phosphate uridylyltransferase [Furfurilactobacillus siliginis]GEK28178.1 galactose-1-phosphate uridylyltransferase [Furfurilactobacillus siliginis]
MQPQLVFDPAIAKNKPENIIHAADYCPFCDVAHLENILAQSGDSIWLTNKFRTLAATNQTVVIENADHNGDIADYSVTENRRIFHFALSCWRQMRQDPAYQSVAFYKNFGPLSGGSLRHPHMQIVGMEAVDVDAALTAKNFSGISVPIVGAVDMNVSVEPVMGFTEINVREVGNEENAFADAIQKVVHYLMNDYFGGRCHSYNLFVHVVDGATICKIVPRFVVSPYFVGYKIPQVNEPSRLQDLAAELSALFKMDSHD